MDEEVKPDLGGKVLCTYCIYGYEYKYEKLRTIGNNTQIDLDNKSFKCLGVQSNGQDILLFCIYNNSFGSAH